MKNTHTFLKKIILFFIPFCSGPNTLQSSPSEELEKFKIAHTASSHSSFIEEGLSLLERQKWDETFVTKFIQDYKVSRPAAVCELMEKTPKDVTLVQLHSAIPTAFNALIQIHAKKKRPEEAERTFHRFEKLLSSMFDVLYVNPPRAYPEIEAPHRIYTIGSCFTRQTASRFTELFGGTVIKNLELHRSDVIVSRYLQRTPGAVPSKEKLEELVFKKDVSDYDKNHFARVLENQYGFGESYNLFEDMEKERPTLILVDSFLDLVGFLMENKDNPDQKAFFNYRIFENGRVSFKEGKRIPVENTIQNFRTIFNEINRVMNHNVQIVFFHWNMSHHDNVDTQQRSKQLNMHFTGHPNVIFLPPFNTSKFLKPGDKYHGVPNVYTTYAHILRMFLADKNIS